MKTIRLNINDYINNKYNFLTIIKDNGVRKNLSRVIAICDCGVSKEYALTKIINNQTKSCGCNLTMRGKNLFKHGLSNHPLFSIWASMKSRCTYDTDTNYENYGLRGVKVCQEWVDSPEAFILWGLENGWREGLDIDKDIKGDGFLYSPDTCCFVTGEVNNNHTRGNKYLLINEELLSMSQVSEKYSINYYLLRKRISMGWSVGDAIKIPSRKTGFIFKNRKPQVAA